MQDEGVIKNNTNLVMVLHLVAVPISLNLVYSVQNTIKQVSK